MKLICSGTDSSAVLECIMYLYVYEGFRGGPDRRVQTEALVIKAVEAFAAENGLVLDGMSREILRTDKGKPYFREIPVRFSVSHTGDLWVCLISGGTEPVGVDIQMIRETRQEKVADRYFTADEKEHLQRHGTDGFFKIWTRKEAYAKYTGRGLTKELAEISTLSNSEVEFVDFDIRAGVKGSCCVKEKGDLCLRTI